MRACLLMLLGLTAPAFAVETSTVSPVQAVEGSATSLPEGVYGASQPRPVVEATRAAAIERSVQQVNWFFRGYARGRLSKVATACPAYQLIVQAPHFEVICDGETVFMWELGKQGTWTTETGDVVHVTLTQKPQAFVLRFDTDADGGSGKQFTYAWNGEGALTVTQEIFSPHLPISVKYSLLYAAQ